MTRRVVVTGGRGFGDYNRIRQTLVALDIAALAQGGAEGADSLARMWGELRRIPVSTYLANWATEGTRAGPLRNRRMLDDFKPDLVVAFRGGKGTADCVKAARERGIEVLEVP